MLTTIGGGLKLEEDIFSIVKGVKKSAHSDDPMDIADYRGIIVVNMNGSIAGYACAFHAKNTVMIGINCRLKGFWYRFCFWHELTHVLNGDIYLPGTNGWITDGKLCRQGVSDHSIPRHEKTANLVAADETVSTYDVIEMTGYNNPSMQSYRRMKAYLEGLTRELENLRCSFDFSHPTPYLKAKVIEMKRKIMEGTETLSEMESELIYSNSFMTLPEIAAELDISERILRYKLEAMRLQGMDIDPQELEQYGKMFDGAI